MDKLPEYISFWLKCLNQIPDLISHQLIVGSIKKVVAIGYISIRFKSFNQVTKYVSKKTTLIITIK